MIHRLSIRPAVEADLEALAELVARANATYQEWTGAGWSPPGIECERLHWRERFDDGAAWNAVAVASGRCLGCVSFTDARAQDGQGAPIAGLAHLSRMFVDPDHWGRGIGSLLLDRATEEMRNRHYRRAQLFTADRNIRSRRFYERHGWRLREDTRPWHGLVLVRYTLDL